MFHITERQILESEELVTETLTSVDMSTISKYAARLGRKPLARATIAALDDSKL